MKSTVAQFESSLLNVTGLELLRKRMYKEAFEYFDLASALGYAKAQYNMGMCYFKGYGCRKDLAKAAECWNNAAKQGHGDALYQMGVLADHESKTSLCKDFMHHAASQNVPEVRNALWLSGTCTRWFCKSSRCTLGEEGRWQRFWING